MPYMQDAICDGNSTTYQEDVVELLFEPGSVQPNLQSSAML